MKTITQIIFAFMFLTTIGCGNKDKSPEQSAELQTAVTVPQVDLHTAVVLDDLEAMGQHIKAGSDLNVLEPSRASTPLITAAALGKTRAAKLLIEAGADLNYKNNDGSTALHTAAFFCHVEIVEALLQKGADKTLTNKAGKTAYDIVTAPFEVVQGLYEAFETELKPAGIKFDYDQIKTARPIIAEMLN